MCAADPFFWVNGFCWTYDPRSLLGAKLPFILWPCQKIAFRSILKSIAEGRDLLIEKSRDMGASWLCLTAFAWHLLYKRDESFLFVSRTENYVDQRGNPKSLFWKLDYLLENLPDSMRPKVDRVRMHISVPENNTVIDGESTNKHSGRGDRRTAILLDEFSAVEDGYQILKATRDTTNCRIFNGTPQGTGNAYYEVGLTKVRRVRLHWTSHPHKAKGLYTKGPDGFEPIDRVWWAKQRGRALARMEEFDEKIRLRGVPLPDNKIRSPWYALQCERAASAAEIAQEVDIDYLGSGYQFFSSMDIESYIAKHCAPPFRVGEYAYDDDTLELLQWRDEERGRWRLWCHLNGAQRPMERNVVIGVDVAAGTGASNSALSVVNRVSLQKIAEYVNPQIRPEAFGRLAVAAAKWFGDATLIWEQGGPGRQFGDAVMEAGYRKIYYRRDEEAVGKQMRNVPGWNATKENKLAVLGDYRRALELGLFVNRSEAALRDCLEYVFTASGAVEHSRSLGKVDPSGARTNHGDRTIADALAWKLCKSDPASKKLSEETVLRGCFLWRRQRRQEKARAKAAW